MPAYELAEMLNAQPMQGLVEAVASYDTVGLYIEPFAFDIDQVTGQRVRSSAPRKPRLHTIPVCYSLGADIESVCESLSLSETELVELHSSLAYRCYAVGFCPGFGYLGYLPPGLSGVPRRPSPRTRVEPGSVAITGNQTAVYPLERPGGWALIGKTPLCLVDVEEGYFPITAGDEVRFHPIAVEEFEARKGERL